MRQNPREFPRTPLAVVARAAALIGLALVLAACKGKNSTGPIPAPTLTSLSPSSGAPGTTVHVSLTGDNFLPDATVAVSGTGVSVDSLSFGGTTSLAADFVIAPSAAPGPRSVTVETIGGLSSAVTFTIGAGSAPNVVAFTPEAKTAPVASRPASGPVAIY